MSLNESIVEDAALEWFGELGYAVAIPAEWRSKDDFSDKMVEYLGEARKNRETLIQFIKHILR
jgi:hypothetical protein